MKELNKICKSYCISNTSSETAFNYHLSKIEHSHLSQTEIENYFGQEQITQGHIELLSNYKVWKNLSSSKKDQQYFVFHGSESMPEGFSTIWDNFISKNLPEDFFVCFVGGYRTEDLTNIGVSEYNDFFCQLTGNSTRSSIDCSFYIINKSAANLVCQHISNQGFGTLDNSFLLNFFLDNKFFSSPEKIFLLKNPIKETFNSATDFFFTEDNLFQKRIALIDMARDWEGIIYESEFEKWRALRPQFPEIPSIIYPEPPKEKFSCYNPGHSTGMVMLYTDESKSYGYQSEISIKNYCFKNDYTLYVYRESIDKDSFPSWSKPEALLNHIDDHDNLVWIDSDTLIFNPDYKLEWIIDGECTFFKKFILSEDLSEACPINSGVVMCRSGDFTKKILNRWIDFKKHNDTSSLYASEGDQVVLYNLLKKADVFKYNHKVFPMSKFNTDPRLITWDTFILHFMAYPNHLKNYFLNFWNFGFPIYK